MKPDKHNDRESTMLRIAVLISMFLVLVGCQLLDIGADDPVPKDLPVAIAVEACQDVSASQEAADRADCLTAEFIKHKTKIDSKFDNFVYDLVKKESNIDAFEWIDLGLDSWQIKVTRDLDKLNSQTAPMDNADAIASLRSDRQSKSDDLNYLQMAGTALKAVNVLLKAVSEDEPELIEQMQSNRRLIANCIQQKITAVRAGVGGYTSDQLRVHLERYRYAGTLRVARNPTIMSC